VGLSENVGFAVDGDSVGNLDGTTVGLVGAFEVGLIVGLILYEQQRFSDGDGQLLVG
jgi:hypothetical protein